MLAVLFTALSVHHLALRHSDRAAALFAAASYLCCPLLLRKLTIAEPDTLVTALSSFAAFLLWWHGNEGNAVRLWRWLACGALLAFLALAKARTGGFLRARGRRAHHPSAALARAFRPVPLPQPPGADRLAWAWSVFRPGDLSVWLHEMRLMHSFDLVSYLADRLRLAVRLGGRSGAGDLGAALAARVVAARAVRRRTAGRACARRLREPRHSGRAGVARAQTPRTRCRPRPRWR